MRKKVLLAAILIAGATQLAFADDIQPPWWRGQYSTTSQMWEFETSQGQNLLPDGPAPGGQPPLPSTYVNVTPGSGKVWLAEDAGRTGVWPISGEIQVQVDNHNPPNEVKIVWVQITWRPQDQGTFPVLYGLDPAATLGPSIVDEVQLDGVWKETTYSWEIRPNPPDERFTIGGLVNVDELVIDTWCIPEPCTLLLLLGLSGLVIRRR